MEIFEQFTEDSEDYIAVPFKEDPKEELAATLENNSWIIISYVLKPTQTICCHKIMQNVTNNIWIKFLFFVMIVLIFFPIPCSTILII